MKIFRNTRPDWCDRDDWHIRVPYEGRIVRVPARTAAVLLGVPHEELVAELKRNGGVLSKIPEDWKRQARRRAKETVAHLSEKEER